MKSVIFSGVRAPISAAVLTGALALGGCAELATVQQGAQAPAPLPVPSSAPRSPQELYKVERVTPVVLSDAPLGWFAGAQGSPRDVGTFVGQSVIQGLEGQFDGAEPVSMEVRIRQFQPSVDAVESQGGGRHALRLDFVLRDSTDGKVVAAAEGLVLDLVALNGTSSVLYGSVADFVDEVSRDTPAPGGGSIAALAGAIGSALASMVVNLSVGKGEYDGRYEELCDLADRAQDIKQLVALLDEADR